MSAFLANPDFSASEKFHALYADPRTRKSALDFLRAQNEDQAISILEKFINSYSPAIPTGALTEIALDPLMCIAMRDKAFTTLFQLNSLDNVKSNQNLAWEIITQTDCPVELKHRAIRLLGVSMVAGSRELAPKLADLYEAEKRKGEGPVSYTHLTLPTNREV